MKSNFLNYVLGASLACYFGYVITHVRFLMFIALVGAIISAGYTLVYDITHHTTPWHRAKAAREELRKQRMNGSRDSSEE